MGTLYYLDGDATQREFKFDDNDSNEIEDAIELLKQRLEYVNIGQYTPTEVEQQESSKYIHMFAPVTVVGPYTMPASKILTIPDPPVAQAPPNYNYAPPPSPFFQNLQGIQKKFAAAEKEEVFAKKQYLKAQEEHAKAVKTGIVALISAQLEKVIATHPNYKPAKENPEAGLKKSLAKHINFAAMYGTPVNKIKENIVFKDAPEDTTAVYEDSEPDSPEGPSTQFPLPMFAEPRLTSVTLQQEARNMFGPKAVNSAVLAEVSQHLWEFLDRDIVMSCVVGQWPHGVNSGNGQNWGLFAAAMKTMKQVNSMPPGPGREKALSVMAGELMSILFGMLKLRHGLMVFLRHNTRLANNLWFDGQQDRETLQWLADEEKKGCIQWGPPRETVSGVKLPDGRVVDLS